MTGKEIAVELTEIRIRGMVARMFSLRSVMPEPAHLEMLRGTREITLRDLGEISFSLGFIMDFSTMPREAASEEAE